MEETPVIQVVGYKDSGKTTTTCFLITEFCKIGMKVGSIKHDAHDFEMDYPGKDTWRHREAGAHMVAIASKTKTAVIEQRENSLEELTAKMQGLDLIFVEGYKMGNYAKIVLLRSEEDLPLIEQTNGIMLISSWFPYHHSTIPVVLIDEKDRLFEILHRFLKRHYWGEAYEKLRRYKREN